MLREEGVEEIYDGCFYRPEDMVPVGCSDCAGCSACCKNTGDSIVLDPYDMYMLTKGTGKTFTDMIEREIEIRLVDGLVLPNLMQQGRKEPESSMAKISASSAKAPEGKHSDGRDLEGPPGEGCAFLSASGRCTIHLFRPGFCRLYPMGRYYTEKGFCYILQKNECTGRKKTPVLLRDWIGVEDLPRYEAFVLDWHDFKKAAEAAMEGLTQRSRGSVRQYILQLFFVHPYLSELDFYTQYAARMEVCREELGRLL